MARPSLFSFGTPEPLRTIPRTNWRAEQGWDPLEAWRGLTAGWTPRKQTSAARSRRFIFARWGNRLHAVGSQQSPGRGRRGRAPSCGRTRRAHRRPELQAGWGLAPNVRFTATQQPAKELVGWPPFQKRKQARENTRDLPGSPSQEMGLTGVFGTLQSASSLGAARGHPREPRQSVGVGVEPSPVTMAKSTEAPYPSRKL